jgi:serine/threonine protein kinase
MADEADTTKQDGGKLLAQGVDGCIFIPKLKCEGNTLDFMRTGRLMLDKLTDRNTAEFEMNIARKISLIPLSSNYFVVPADICTPQPLKNQTEPELKKCEIQTEFKNTKILRMPYGGVSLYDYSFKLNTFSPLKFTRHLLEAGALMALNGIIHNDLHQGNILMDEHGVPRIIDFGRALFSYEHVTEKFFIHSYSAGYFQECPDFFLLNAKNNGYNIKIAIGDFLSKRKIMIDQLTGFYAIEPENIAENMEEYTLLSTSYKKGDYVGWFRHHWRTIDSWAIGVRLLDAFFNLLYFPEFEKKWKIEGGPIWSVIKRMVEIDPFRRIDCVQALDMLDYLEGLEGENIIIQKYGQKWLDKIGRVR